MFSCFSMPLYSLKFRAFPVILFFYQNEVLQFYKIKLWKVHCFKNLIVSVVRNEIFSLPTDGTIYKLVVIRISINKIEMPCGTYTNKVAAIDKGLYNNVCEIQCSSSILSIASPFNWPESQRRSASFCTFRA